MESRRALDEFLDVIRNADQTFLDPEKELDGQGKVDGYHHFFHLLQVAVDFYLHNDPLRPQLMPLANRNRKLYGDNVDAVYYFSQVRGDQEYVISGQRFDSCYLSFSLYGGDPNGELADRVTLNVNHRDIEFAEDGTFEIRLTPEPKGVNEFRIDPDSVSLFTREYFFDRPGIAGEHAAHPQRLTATTPIAARRCRSSHVESATWRCSSSARHGSRRCRSNSRSTNSVRRSSSTRTRADGERWTTSTASPGSGSARIST